MESFAVNLNMVFYIIGKLISYSRPNVVGAYLLSSVASSELSYVP